MAESGALLWNCRAERCFRDRVVPVRTRRRTRACRGGRDTLSGGPWRGNAEERARADEDMLEPCPNCSMRSTAYKTS